MSSSLSFLVGALRSSVCAASISMASTTVWIATLVNMLRVDRAPDILNTLLLVSMVVTKQPPYLIAARCRACIRSRSSSVGCCALPRLHSQPLISWLR
jgi:hypothetical protein